MRRTRLQWPAVLATVLAVALVGCGDDDDSGPTAATGGGSMSVTISANTVSGNVPLVVALRADVSGGRGPYTYAWSFGDGTASSLESPTVRYTVGGFYDVTVTVTSADGLTATSSAVRVTVDNGLGVTCHTAPHQQLVGGFVDFRADTVGGGENFGFVWSFGDGTTGTGPFVRHIYNSAGNFTARVTATSGAVQSTCASGVQIFDRLFATCRANPNTGNAPLVTRFNARANFCATEEVGSCVWEWNFGDGSTLVGPGANTPTHTYNAAGRYVAHVRLRTGNYKDDCDIVVNVQ